MNPHSGRQDYEEHKTIDTSMMDQPIEDRLVMYSKNEYNQFQSEVYTYTSRPGFVDPEEAHRMASRQANSRMLRSPDRGRSAQTQAILG
jgi:hypothetical protein